LKKYITIKKFILIPLLILFVFIDEGLCQDVPDSIRSAFTSYRENNLQEKIYVQTDKNFYVAGEILWFSIFDVNANNNRPLTLSKVAYVEIINSANKPILQARVSLDDACGDGSFYLPAAMVSGNYKLRAYTNWMKNFNPGFYFEKEITIVNVQEHLPVPDEHLSEKYDVQFFPEGGNLVENIQSVVAFKATDQYGKGNDFTGFLMDNNDTLLTFKPLHDGMGNFHLTPTPGHKYRALLVMKSGNVVEKGLPEPYPTGYVMHCIDDEKLLKIFVKSNAEITGYVYLVAQTRGVIKMLLSDLLKDGQVVFSVDKSALGDGISQLTIFNELGQPVCERLFCKKPEHIIDLKVHTTESVYSTRKPVLLTINADSVIDTKDSTTLSLSVYRIDSLPLPEPVDITSYLLLSSDLKGYIDDPGYYFRADDSIATEALDNLMLTNGWRRFKWEDVLHHTQQKLLFPPEYNGMLIAAKVINTLSGEPAGDIECFMGIPGIESAFSTSTSDSAGGITFELRNVYGAPTLIMEPDVMKDSIYRIDITDAFSDAYANKPFPLFRLVPSDSSDLKLQSVSMQVQNLYNGKNLVNMDNHAIDTTTFFGKSDERYWLDDYVRYTTVEEILREYVILADVHKHDKQYHYRLFNFAKDEMLKTDPLVLLDGVPVFDLNKFMTLDPLLLNRLDVVNRIYFLGSSHFSGILSWTSYKGDMAGYEVSPHATIINFEGLQQEREFYSPEYATEEDQSSHIPDFRNVLFWKPNIRLAPGGSVSLNFYTSDIPGKYGIRVEGLSKNGHPGNTFATFEVTR
jgi:hypothetical protein